ncbi:MAG TPA: DUF3622 domain-containing protein [Gammaproteobacteria bacterium]|nr:DUF3622 domain-containing protein [Gammaproteobacteria bacterium]
MTTNKKYEYRVVQGKTHWMAEITRRVTSRKTVVSKSQDGFSTETDAKKWGEKELASFLENLTKRNKRDFEQHLKNKKEKALREEAYKQRKTTPENSGSENADHNRNSETNEQTPDQ